MIRKVFRIPEEVRTARHRKRAAGRPVAAPFDIPSSIVMTVRQNVMSLRFMYIGDNEPVSTERIGNLEVGFGGISGRLLSIVITGKDITEAVEQAIANLEARRNMLSIIPGQSLRKAAHYDIVGSDVLPFVEQQLEKLRLDQAP